MQNIASEPTIHIESDSKFDSIIIFIQECNIKKNYDFDSFKINGYSLEDKSHKLWNNLLKPEYLHMSKVRQTPQDKPTGRWRKWKYCYNQKHQNGITRFQGNWSRDYTKFV